MNAIDMVPRFNAMRGRICIGGGPRSGKTTLANHCEAVGLTVHHTDVVMDMGWSEASAEVATWLEEAGPWVIEGVAVARALRKWLAAHPGDERPCEILYWASRALVPRTTRQEGMSKGCDTVLREIRPELERRGVEILEVP